MQVVVVESPAKAKTVRGYLGAGYEVFATRGTVRDLPAKDGSVDPARDFALKYATRRAAAPTLGRIAAALKEAEGLVLATDPDREGEAIAWQVLEWLQEKGAARGKAVRRVVFHEVTAEAVREAMERPRDLDMDLVRAQQARRALDYLVGFHLSALLWRKVRGGRSAGRVQSVALRLVCAREAEIEAFEPQEFWTVDADAMADGGGSFTARLSGLDGEELERLSLGADAAAEAAAERIRAGLFRVASLERDEVRRDPVPPFTTATLQQEASRRLGFGLRKTMQIAQSLFEGVELEGGTTGLVTYVRTDSVALSRGAAASARKHVRAAFGPDYLPRKARVFRSRARNAQEAHEAIRPTDIARTPEAVAGRLGADRAALYGLIWKRTVASQMASARLDRVRVRLATEAGDVVLTASGARTAFDGFMRIWREDGGEEDEAGQDRRLPAMAEGERVFVTEVRPERRLTAAPLRFTEADLVRRLEELGIGRPSTYASIVGVLRERGYAVLYRRRFVPTERGRVVTAFLEAYFGKWVAYRFTTDMEADLDRVAAGGMAWKAVLGSFWGAFEDALEKAGGLRRDDVREAVEGALSVYLFGPPGGAGERPCPACTDGELMLKLGRYGPFVGCTHYPDCRHSRPLSADPADDGASRGPVPLGTDPGTGLALTLRRGRYGRYVQRGEDEGKTRAARGTVPADMAADEITPEIACALLTLPRTVGTHPETGKRILAGIGRYGSWLKHGVEYVALPDDEDVLSVGLNRAVALVDAKDGR
ncbi:MAG: type I DNA topoisomerase [Alphaproteobacteria bacterium]|nr:type I DNA topoisomerase [Alphaproteobacteria bacterium]